jgi:hypothetical protein
MFDGVRDRLLSEEIRPYLFGGQPDITPVDWNYAYFSKAAQVASPPMYVCACPLQGQATPAIFAGVSVSAVQANSGPPQFTAGTYYLRVQATMVSGQTFVSGEYVVNCVTGTVNGLPTYSLGISIQLPANSQVASWQIYMGNSGSGSEHQYITRYATTYINNTTTFTTGSPATSLGGALTRLFCYDLVIKAWTVIDLPFPISVLKQFRTQGSIPITVMGGFSDGAIRRWLGGAGFDLQWDAGAVNAGAPDANVRWSVRTPEVFGKDASDRVYFRSLALRGIGNPTGITASVVTNGLTGPALAIRNMVVNPMGGGEFAAYADIGVTGVDANATISGSGPIEIQSVDWLAIAKAIRGRVTV